MNKRTALTSFAILLLALVVGSVNAEERPLPEGFCEWKVTDFEIKEPICGLTGDAERGRIIAADSPLGNCLACHIMPIPEEEFQGTVGPPLMGVGARYSEGAIRLRVVDEQQINPMTIMPGFYADPRKANRVADEYFGKTFLTAQQVEDVVAYLRTLK
ncbi:MAG: sulfur oxidation c-type cytochrome SoxX [Gammaproteobacteria bacterium]